MTGSETLLKLKSKVILNYKYIICQLKLNLIDSNVIICFILTSFLTLPSPLKVQNFRTPNKSLMSVCCVCESLDSKLVSVCFIDD